MKMKTLGQIGYEAYAVATGGKTFDGRDMPTWAQVQASGTKVEAAWEFAAKAIRGECAVRLREGLQEVLNAQLPRSEDENPAQPEPASLKQQITTEGPA